MSTVRNKRPQRVLFAHDGPVMMLPSGRVAGVHLTEDLVRRYRNLGDEITFFLRGKEVLGRANQYSPLDGPGVQFVRAPDAKGPLLLLRYGSTLRKAVMWQVSAHDVIVCRLPSQIGSWAFVEAQRQGKAVLVEFVACTWDSLWNYGFMGKLTAPYFYVKNRLLMRGAPYSIYVTEEFLQGRYPSRGVHIACSDVELSHTDLAVCEKRRRRIEAESPDQRLVLSTVASVEVPYKNQELVLKALAILRDAGVSVEYRVVGQGDPSRLQRLASLLDVTEMFQVVGPVPHSRIHEVFDDTDIYIQPSRQEGLPRALIEAMSRACPALGASTGGIPELLPSSRIFDPDRADQLASMIQGFSKSTLQADARRNWERAQDFTRDKLSARRISFYETFLKDNGLDTANLTR